MRNIIDGWSSLQTKSVLSGFNESGWEVYSLKAPVDFFTPGCEIVKFFFIFMLIFGLLRFWARRYLGNEQHQGATLEEANKTDSTLLSYSVVEKEDVSS